MGSSRANRLTVAVCGVLYLMVFLLSHVDEDHYSGALSLVLQIAWVVCLAAPLVGVVFLAREWPNLWLVPIVFALFTAVPMLVEEIERQAEWYPVGATAADYAGGGGMDYVSTGIFAAYAWPIAMVTVGAVLLEQRRARRRGEHAKDVVKIDAPAAADD